MMDLHGFESFPVHLQDRVDGDRDPNDGLAGVERRGCDQPVVGGLDHQLAAAHLGEIRMA